MENAIENARNNMLEWYFIFSCTGDIEDGRAFIEAMRELDLLLSAEEEREL